jgi:hypothetical protein
LVVILVAMLSVPCRCLGCGGLNQLVEFGVDLGFEVSLDLVHLGELGKRPAAIAAQVVDAGHPVGVHGGLLLDGVFAPVAFDLDHQVQRVAGPWPSSTSTMKSGRYLRITEPNRYGTSSPRLWFLT